MILHLATAMAALLCLIGGIFAVVLYRRERGAQEARERLAALVQATPGAGETETVRQEVDVRSLLPLWFRRRLFQAGIQLDASRLALVLLSFVALWIVLVLSFDILIATTATTALAGSAVGLLDYAATRRMEALSGCMSGFLDRVRQLLAVGNALSVALVRAKLDLPRSRDLSFFGELGRRPGFDERRVGFRGIGLRSVGGESADGNESEDEPNDEGEENVGHATEPRGPRR